MKTLLSKSILLLAAGLGFAAPSMAIPAWVDVDFFATTNGTGVTPTAATITPYNPGAAAIGASTDLWNDINISTPAYNPANLPATTSLHDVLGSFTTASLTINAGTRGADGVLPATPVQNELFTPGFYDLNATISGLTPHATYDVLLYGPYAVANLTVNGNSFPGWSTVGGSWSSWVPGVGYNVMAETASATGTIVINDPSTAEQITAIQIAPVPEPSTWALAGMGVVSLLAYRRRFGKASTGRPPWIVRPR